MRLLLLQSSAYVPSLGGANKANRLLLEQLAARGHECHVIGTAGESRAESVESCLTRLAAAGVKGAAPRPDEPGGVAFRHGGVTVEAVLDGARLRAHAAARLRRLAPDRVLVSSEDPAQILLSEAVAAKAAPVVYVAHTTLHLPLGPDGFLASPTQTGLLRQAAGIIAVSAYVQDYLRRWAGLESTLLRFPVYGAGPFPPLADFDGGSVMLINPCAVKGISIFLALARRCPDLRFAAVPTWGTTVEDRAALAALPNVEILEPTADVDRLFARCRVLLVPSLWGEAFGQVAVEAMLRGVPVLASDAGGLPEAALGVGRVLPVRPIRRYEERFDERKIPVAVVPEQDVEPWEAALREILADRGRYQDLSQDSQRSAHAFVSGLGIEPFEGFLAGLPVHAAGRRRMKVLLVQPLNYLFTPGGAHKANRLLLQGLAARGHDCRVIAPESTGEAVFTHEGVEVHAVDGGLELCSEAARQIRTFAPDWTIVSEDPSGEILQEVLEASPLRVVYLAHSPATLPFGPASFALDEAKTALLRRTAGILTVSRAMQDYFRRWAGIDSAVVYSPAYGSGPFPALGAFDRGYVTMINPSGIKGVSIFAGLARRMPGVAFAAVPTWSTTAADRDLLASLPNVTLLPAVDDVDQLFARVRVLVVPSLWGEAFGQVVVEALLRGIPVLTSDQGGLPEAGLGVTRIVPVRPIERYEERLDDRRMPVPVLPAQDLDRWEAELRALLTGREGYERLSAAAREASARFVSGLGIEPYERFLADLAPAPVAAAAVPPAMADVRQKVTSLSPEKLELLARRLKKKEGAPPPAPGIPRLTRSAEPGGDRFPLSFAQQRLWFLDRFEPGSLSYNEHFAIRLDGRVEVRMLGAALDQILQRHEVLRTTYAEGEDEPVQIVHARRPDDHLALPLVDLGALPEPARRTEAARLATAESRRPFDLERGPVLRVLLLSLGVAESLLLITAHHIAVDNWSVSVLFAELSELYGAWEAGRAPALPELPVQYADFAAWQRGWLTGEVLEGQLGFWRRQLAGAPALLDLPADRPRPAHQSFRGSRVTARFPARLAEAVRAPARRRDATLYMLLLAVFQTLLYRLSGQDDLVVGTPVAGRNRKEVEPLIGFFLNTLPMRTRLASADPFQALLGRARQTALDAFAYQDLPFERLVEALAPERSLSHAPLFQILFNFLNVPPRTEELPGGVRLTAASVQTGTTRFDLELYMEEQDPGLVVALDFNTDLFDAATATRLLVQLEILLAGVAERPEAPLWALPLLTAAESHQLQHEWNDTAVETAEGPGVHQLFAEQVRRTPDVPAAAFQETSLTYAELADRARQLARQLRRLGCGPETQVGIALERGLDMPIALLGVLEAGASYVPLDPGYPRERLALVLEDAAPRVLITQKDLLPGLPPTTASVLYLDGEPASGSSEAEFPFHDLQRAYTLYTSGSTGRPKGVEISHRALVNFLGSMRRAPGFAPGGRLLAVTSLAFDIAALEIFLPLTTGGCVELASRDEASDGTLLAARLRASGAGLLQGTPATWRMLLDTGWDGDPALRALCGGEALPRDLAALLTGRTRELWNLYGPTETTVWSAAVRIRPDETGPVSIGRPIAATRIHLLDRDLRTAPLGVPGELLIGGAGLARGYLGRPDLTAERFVPDPFGEPGDRLYRTGDLARHLPGGRMEVLGRIDQQIKLRGFRIELGEIEAALTQIPGVREAAVALRGGSLVAYVVPREEAPTATGLRDALRRSLPEPMIPTAFVVLPALPQTPNRKVDRKALPDPGPAGGPGPFVAPRTPVEEVLAGIWAEVLGLEHVGSADHFFHLGGHSLLATRVVSRLRAAFGVEIPLRDLFETPVLADLAARLAAALRAGAEPPAPPLVRVPRDGSLPLSFAQQRLWFIDQLEPGAPLYNMPVALRVEGPLDRTALARSLGEVVRRHEALRTAFAAQDGAAVQEIRPAEPFALPLVDLAGLPDPEQQARALAAEEAARPFDLTRGPLLRGLLLRLSGNDHVATLTAHHIASDGWSMGILVREVTALYTAFAEGRPSPLPELPVQYADYAVWQRSWLHGEVLEAEISYWRRQLAGLPPLLDLPADRPRPANRSFRGASRPLRLSRELSRQAQALGRRDGATPFMVLLAAFQALLARLSGQDDFAVGTPVHGRTRVETEGLIGFFVNTLVLRSGVPGPPSFRQLLGRIRETSLAAHAHQDVPFEKLVQELDPERSLAHAPLFQVMLVLQNAPAGELKIPGLRLRPSGGARTTAQLDLTLGIEERDGELHGTFEHATDLFDATSIDRLAGHFERLLAAAAEAPELSVWALPLLSPAERAQLLVEWNDTAPAPAPGATLHELFAAQARRTPEAVALVDGDREIPYRELARMASRWADELRRRGAGPEVVVGLQLERSAEMVIALLAILEAGAAYLPLDPKLPPARRETLIAEARASLVIEEGLPPLPGGSECGWERGSGGEGHPDNLAYVLFTSGSTGTPKGVAVTHRSAVELVRWAGTVFSLGELAGVLASTSLAFDLSVFEIFVPLCQGGTVVLAQNALELPALLASGCAAGRVTLVNTVPSAMAELAGTLGSGTSIRTVNLAGEPLTRSLADRVHAVNTVERLWNLYGPSECTTYSTYACVPREGSAEPDIGRPITDTRAYVLEAGPESLPVPAGVAGELYLGGAGLARGYLHRPDLTAERFVPHPFGSGERLFRTGDLVRRSGDGALHFLGRLDHQVKVRGFRIELGEIEVVLASLPGVREAAVLVREDRLVAYVAGDPAALEAATLRRSLRERLPDYMVPAVFVPLPELPLTSNGKLDRKALPAPDGWRADGDLAAPRTPVEEILAALYSDVLGVPNVGRGDSFFDLGGHSLLATRIVSRLRGVFGVELPLRTLFERPRVAELAAAVEDARREGEGPAAPPLVPVPRGRDLPLSFAQQRLWFLDRLVPGNPFYNVPVALELRGGLDLPAIAGALGEVVRRHEALRTTFPAVEGKPVQVVTPAFSSPLSLADLQGLPAEARAAEALRLAREEAERPFDLARGPLVRWTMLRLAPDEHVLLLMMHHIVSDGWSVGVLMRELSALYAAFALRRPSPLPELPVQYPDFALWQREWLQGDVLSAQLAYWKKQLAEPPVLDLPTDRPRPVLGTFRGAVCDGVLSRELMDGASTFARGRSATLFMVLLAAWKTLLWRYSGQLDLLVGSPIANRNRIEIEGLIGFFVNELALRADLSRAGSFGGLTGLVREATLGAYAHQDLPFEKLVEELHPERDIARNPLIQVCLVLQSFPEPPAPPPGIALRLIEVAPTTSKFDLTLFLMQGEHGLKASLEYCSDLFDPATVVRLMEHYRILLTGALADPERRLSGLPLLRAEERAQLLTEWNDTRRDLPSGALAHEPISAVAQRSPGAVAAVWDGGEITYDALERHSNQLARRLRRLGVGPEVPVGLCVDRSGDLLVGILGILKAGGAYVPLDPEYPRERLDYMLADCGAPVLVTQERTADLAAAAGARPVFLDVGEPGISQEDDGPIPPSTVLPESPVYVIYTSGSTGRPKGVVVTHRGLVSSTAARRTFYREPVATYLLASSFAFDSSVAGLFWTLWDGGTLILPRDQFQFDLPRFLALLECHRASHLLCLPSLYSLILEHAEAARLGSLRAVIVAGEACHAALVSRHFERLPTVTLVNEYGPTEGTVWSSGWTGSAVAEPAPSQIVPIGRPIDNVRLLLLDRDLGLVPAGVHGEIWLGGEGLARGYLGRPDLTAERFIPHPFAEEPGDRLYRTGDRARYRPDGQVEFLGRFDHQVKIRGFRIEPGEIEAILREHPAVREAAVVAREDAAGGPRLVAYVAADPASEALADESAVSAQVEQWQTVFEGTYTQGGSEVAADAAFDITGWKSRYDGQPIPAEQMREWVEGTVERLLAERPTRVLEIGCGTGLLLFRIAPHVEHYLGTDFSPRVIEQLRQRLAALGPPQAEADCRAAHDFSGIEPGSFDAVILNSVAQYFPGVDYLLEVLEGAVHALAPGGLLFLGDVRSLPLAEALHTSVELFQAPSSTTVADLRRRIGKAVARDEELLLDPDLFAALAQRFPRIGRTEVQVRRGRHPNELTRFRYDALLHLRPPGASAADRLDWRRDGLTVSSLRERLSGTAPQALEIFGIPNARLTGEAAALALLGGEAGLETVQDLRRAAAQRAQVTLAVDPEDLWALGRELGYQTVVTWSGQGPDRLDVRFARLAPGEEPPSFPAAEGPPRPWRSYANDPLAARLSQRLVPLLREHLLGTLPDYMVPAAFVMLEALPRTPNGKLDRRALPDPEGPRPGAGLYVEPHTPLEQAIARIWQEVLGLDQVGRDDNFFDAGGHSLLMIQVHTRLCKQLGLDLAVVELFQYPTVRALAEYLEGGAVPAPRPAPVAPPLAGPTAGFAVVGMAGRFPGAATVDELWANLLDGREAVVPFSDDEIRAAGVGPDMLTDPRYVKAGPVLDGIEWFDAEFFGYSPREAEMMDPQHRLFLEACWQALEDAGYDPRRVPGGTGVWGGADMSTYALHLLTRPDLLQAAGLWATQHGIDKDFLPTRVSYELDLSGPSVAVQTACSTSLVAVHLACRSLAGGECDVALAGGVHVQAPQKTGYLYEEGAINSPDGHCRAFDAKARGTFTGSGVGVVVLKRLEDALRDGDTIHAVIRGTAINNDGSRKVGFTAPSIEGQARVIAAAQAAAGVSPATIGYVEAHGTGTPLGDPIEVAALTRAFRLTGERMDEPGFCGLGSIKTNIGHLGAAAGVAGLIKTVLSLKHRRIPPSLHFETPNPAIDFSASPFRVVDRLTGWTSDGTPLRAGVSSFGIGGTNAHAVLEEAPPTEPSGASRPWQLLFLSARSAAALDEATGNLAAFLERNPEASLADVAHTLRVGRHPFEHRRMLVCSSREDALAALRSQDPERLLTRRRESDPPSTAWLLPGQGSQHAGMGRDLYESEPVFRRGIDACAESLALRPGRLGRDLREILFAAHGAELAATRWAQPALFAVEHALARLWLSWGLRPRALIGHSLGEYVAACLAGVLSLEDALALVAARGELMQELPSGAMLSVDLSEGETLAEMAASPGLSLAAVNGSRQCTVSGPVAEIDALAERLSWRAVPCRRLHTSHAFHSGMMDPILGRFAGIVSRIELRPPSIPYLSNLTGTWITAAEATDPRYWTRHLRETVRFADGVSQLLTELPPGVVLLEVGPGRVLGRLLRGQAASRPVLASMPHPDSAESGAAALLHAVGHLWLAGVEIDWQAFQGDERRRRIPLPTYPFQRRRHWVEPGRGGLPGRLAPGVAPVALLLPEDAATDPAWAAALEARGFRTVAVPPGGRPEVLDGLLGVQHPAAGEVAPAGSDPLSGHVRPGIETPYEAPRTEAERRLATIWGGLLGIDRVGVHDDLFDLGGDSMTATRLVWRVREAFRVEIPLEAIFSASTIARFAPLLTAGVEERPVLEVPPIVPVPRRGDIPLSFAQQQIWVIQQFDPANPAYSMHEAFRLLGPLDPASMAWGLSQVVARHEVLRTTYPMFEGWPIQRIAPSAGVSLPLVDLTGLEETRAWEEMLAYIAQDPQIPFDLACGPLLRAALLRLGPEDHVLCVNLHHIGFDGWSWEILFSELTNLYDACRAGRPSPLPPLPIQCADFAIWQRDHAADLEGHLEWWKERLAGLVPLQLAPDRPPGAGEAAGAREELWLPAPLADSLRALGRTEDCTIFMVLLALFKVLLHHRTGREDVSVGSLVAGRLTPEIEGMIGNFINTFLLRTSLAGDPTFREILARVKETTLGAHAHQEIPYEQVVAALHEGKDRRTRLFEVWFVVHIHTKPKTLLSLAGGLALTQMRVDSPAPRHDLSFSLWPTPEGIGAEIEYRSDLFTRAAMRQMAEDYAALAQAVVDDADIRCSTLADLLTKAQQERQGTRKELAKVAGLEKLRARRRQKLEISTTEEGSVS